MTTERQGEATTVETMYSVPEVAELLGVKPGTIYSLCAANYLRHVRVGRKIKVPASAINEFVARGGVQ